MALLQGISVACNVTLLSSRVSTLRYPDDFNGNGIPMAPSWKLISFIPGTLPRGFVRCRASPLFSLSSASSQSYVNTSPPMSTFDIRTTLYFRLPPNKHSKLSLPTLTFLRPNDPSIRPAASSVCKLPAQIGLIFASTSMVHKHAPYPQPKANETTARSSSSNLKTSNNTHQFVRLQFFRGRRQAERLAAPEKDRQLSESRNAQPASAQETQFERPNLATSRYMSPRAMLRTGLCEEANIHQLVLLDLGPGRQTGLYAISTSNNLLEKMIANYGVALLLQGDGIGMLADPNRTKPENCDVVESKGHQAFETNVLDARRLELEVELWRTAWRGLLGSFMPKPAGMVCRRLAKWP
ncbi:hypothetical protein BJ508DRAFT_314562 [Ascobolus immersus RN42]|uniref:Uncharacterized protein n=1 Tax=Ascobolus immersus RN42 TaxID=1160509 RepID=A0A3N4HGH6_ASCIM|nr:hypothetical protein BJ508DRAFT_314562 [Ascobolus immersus RN42]